MFLAVPKKPKIKRKPKDENVSAKEAAMFKCKVDGFPRPDVKWLKDGREIRDTDVIHTGKS